MHICDSYMHWVQSWQVGIGLLYIWDRLTWLSSQNRSTVHFRTFYTENLERIEKLVLKYKSVFWGLKQSEREIHQSSTDLYSDGSCNNRSLDICGYCSLRSTLQFENIYCILPEYILQDQPSAYARTTHCLDWHASICFCNKCMSTRDVYWISSTCLWQ